MLLLKTSCKSAVSGMIPPITPLKPIEFSKDSASNSEHKTERLVGSSFVIGDGVRVGVLDIKIVGEMVGVDWLVFVLVIVGDGVFVELVAITVELDGAGDSWVIWWLGVTLSLIVAVFEDPQLIINMLINVIKES